MVKGVVGSNAMTCQIAKFLATPCKIANRLEWHKGSGAILSLNVLSSHIDLVVSSHPELYEPVYILPPVPIKKYTVGNKKVIDKSVAEELVQRTVDFSLCGIVVHWPVQKDGWCGAQCGSVLHVLDALAESGKVLHPSRPLSLYDKNHHVPTSKADLYGRDPRFGRIGPLSTNGKNPIVFSSKKRVHEDDHRQHHDVGTHALDLWNDFSMKHWPHIMDRQDAQLYIPESMSNNSLDCISVVEDEPITANVA